ncbi:undecaprenyl-diphosphatase [Haladaptatus sp. DYF46]|uniref:undecaprenyl-diphosphatase n=1 Tax=Haladaptatus sp. DYF46 TaxID=2886041 RepID=UPI001E3AAEE4|nr:undecaprenyl-diphosphatase [Haladaptatus sp. DYF46]
MPTLGLLPRYGQLFTSHLRHPLLNEIMIFAAEGLVYLIPLVLLYLWFTPEGKRTNSAFQMTLTLPQVTTEDGKAKSVFIFITIVVSLVISYVLGQLYSHPAPYMVGYDTLLVDAPENSFPSQHTTVVFAFAWAVCYVQNRWRDGLIAVMLASLVGISRVYVGVHFPIDIIGAVGASLLGFIIVYAARKPVRAFANQCIRIEEYITEMVI